MFELLTFFPLNPVSLQTPIELGAGNENLSRGSLATRALGFGC